ncbi:hypothetical protein DAPPUDRAFT_261022 [Daphnia pulex]|uniref:Uncharacterized protein n=1 Tax=Daphnia pulex TaxID=6669 RepID=E9HKE1_DAPPU|nr:hypothetical protein DAPPUDRAFT_261022 [Daphnia pulex]|eukprot:EFX67770.1 hypothetical protein DAPPUDRAFT_261022 [Daphnia pulex]
MNIQRELGEEGEWDEAPEAFPSSSPPSGPLLPPSKAKLPGLAEKSRAVEFVG